jgi:hypothetical protein
MLDDKIKSAPGRAVVLGLSAGVARVGVAGAVLEPKRRLSPLWLSRPPGICPARRSQAKSARGRDGQTIDLVMPR